MADGVRRSWIELPEDFRDRIDELIRRRETFLAIRLVWQESGVNPRPSLPEAVDLVDKRSHQLRLREREPGA
ncbi:hypothetical protein [Micromonospora sp. NPDC005806]|uniref:hypothetical protein n=1 Tax=Micromonospora sp. NPDC005806 TaxID=3364234 RepID=UPI003690C5DA